MATTPTQLPVPSEKPQDLKFNAGKIDEFVTSVALKYIDRLGGEHYTIEGIKQLAFEAMSNFGYVTISSFDGGATLTDPNQALLWESNGEYYKWTGNLPKTVPAGSTPDSTGGIGPGAWLSIGDSLLRSMLASSTGSQLVGTNHRGTLELDLDAIDIRTSGRDVADLLSESKDLFYDTDEHVQANITYRASISGGANGKITPVKGTAGYTVSASSTGTRVQNLLVAGDGTVSPSDTSPTVGSVIAGSDTVITGSTVKDVSMGVSLATGVKGVKLIGNHYENMTSHDSLGAGGYGALLQGVEDLLILGQNSYGTNPQDRHAVYLSESTANLRQNKGVRIIGLYADYSGAINGGKPEQTAPAIYGRGNSGVIISDIQIFNAGSGIGFTDERQAYENININNFQLNNITATDSANFDNFGIRLLGSAGRSNAFGNISNGTITMAYKSGNTGARSVPIVVDRFRFLNISNVVCSSPGVTPVIRLIGARDVNISNIISLVNDNTPSASAVALIEFSGACTDINVSNLNKGGARSQYFSGLDNVSNLKVDFPRTVSVSCVSSAITTTDPNSLISGATITGTGQITVNFKNHVTGLALDGFALKTNNINGAVVTGTRSGRSIVFNIYNSAGVLVSLSSIAVGFSVTLVC